MYTTTVANLFGKIGKIKKRAGISTGSSSFNGTQDYLLLPEPFGVNVQLVLVVSLLRRLLHIPLRIIPQALARRDRPLSHSLSALCPFTGALLCESQKEMISLFLYYSLVNGVGGIRTPVLTHLCIVYYMFSLLSRLFPEKRDIF